MHGAELLGHGTGRGRARVKVCGAGRGKKASKSTDFGQNWILPRNCLLNFIGIKLTLLRWAPQVLVIFTGGAGQSLLFTGWGGPGRASLVHTLWITFYLPLSKKSKLNFGTEKSIIRWSVYPWQWQWTLGQWMRCLLRCNNDVTFVSEDGLLCPAHKAMPSSHNAPQIFTWPLSGVESISGNYFELFWIVFDCFG